MTKPLPFTKASIHPAIQAAESAGLRVTLINPNPDGSLVVEKDDKAVPPAPGSVHDDPFVQAVRNSRYAKTSGRRHVRS